MNNKILDHDPFIDSTIYNTKSIPNVENSDLIHCSNCNRVLESYINLLCKHLLCPKCFYHSINTTDENHRKNNYIKCCICNKLFQNNYKILEKANIVNKYRNHVDSDTIISIQEVLNNAGRIPKHCATCGHKMFDKNQCFCIQCQLYTCIQCAETKHNDMLDNHTIIRVRTNSNGFGTAIEKIFPINQYIGCQYCSNNNEICLNNCHPTSKIHNIIPRTINQSQTTLENYQCQIHPSMPVQFCCMSCKSICICAKCCIGAEAEHTKGHIVMDLEGAWNVIMYQITGAEQGKSIGMLNEYKRLTQMSGSIVIQLQNSMEKIMQVLNDIVTETYQIIDTKSNELINTVNDSFDYIVEELLNKNIDETSLLKIAPAVYASNNILTRKNPMSIVWYYNQWKEFCKPFPPDIVQTNLICSAIEARLNKAKFIVRWIEEQIAFHYSNCVNGRDQINNLLISQVVLNTDSVQPDINANTFLDQSQAEQPIFVNEESTFITPLGKDNFYSLNQISNDEKENRWRAIKELSNITNNLNNLLEDKN